MKKLWIIILCFFHSASCCLCRFSHMHIYPVSRCAVAFIHTYIFKSSSKKSQKIPQNNFFFFNRTGVATKNNIFLKAFVHIMHFYVFWCFIFVYTISISRIFFFESQSTSQIMWMTLLTGRNVQKCLSVCDLSTVTIKKEKSKSKV